MEAELMLPGDPNLPPGCRESDCDPDYESEKERKERLREEALETKADYEDRRQ